MSLTTKQIAESISAHSSRTDYQGPIKYTLPDGRVEEIAQWHNPNIMIDKILSHNAVTNLTSVMIVGGMGTGKSTLATFLAHEFHTRANYVVRWMTKHDLQNIDARIKELPAIPHVLVFEDSSLAMKGMNTNRKADILSSITTIRHNFGGAKGDDVNVIMITISHYQNSNEKMYRNFSHYRFFTDIEREDQGVLDKLTEGKYKTKLNAFARVCDEQFEAKKFTVSLSPKQDRTYETNNPFRFCGVLTRRGFSFMLYPKASCKMCVQPDGANKRFVSPEILVNEAVTKYKQDAPLVLKIMCLMHGVRNHMRKPFMYAWDDIHKVLSEYDVDWNELGKFLRERSQLKESNYYRKQLHDETGKRLGPKDQIEFIESVKEKSE